MTRPHAKKKSFFMHICGHVIFRFIERQSAIPCLVHSRNVDVPSMSSVGLFARWTVWKSKDYEYQSINPFSSLNPPLQRSKFSKAIPQKDFPKVAKELEKRMFSIPEMGPYLVVGQYNNAGESITKAEQSNDAVCDSCLKGNMTLRKCSVCHSAKYCSVECQKEAWKQHKLECKRDTPAAPSTATPAPTTKIAPSSEKLEGVD